MTFRMERPMMPFRTACLTLLCVSICARLPARGGQLVRVGIYQNPPKLGLSPTGHPQGIFVDLIGEIARREGWTLEYVPGTWSQSLDRLASAQIDLLPDVARTHGREAIYAFHQEPVLSDWFQVYTPRKSDIHSILDLNGKRVTLLERSIQEESFSQIVLGFNLAITLVPCADYASAFEAVAKGDADAVIANRFYGMAHLDDYQMADTSIIFNPTRLFFAAPKKADQNLLRVIDRHLTQFKQSPSSVYYRSLLRWTNDEHDARFPFWLKATLLTLFGLTSALLTASIALKRQVAAKTHDLAVRNTQLLTVCQQSDEAKAALHESELKYRMLFESASVAIHLIRGNRQIECNEQTLQLFGCTREDFLSSTVTSLSPPFQPDGRSSSIASETYIARAQAEGPQYFEWLFRRQDGSTFTAEVSLSCVGVNGDSLIQCMLRDITERKAMETALRESDERFTAFMENLPAAAFIKNSQGQTLYINRYLHDLLGWKEWEGRPTTDLIKGQLGRQMTEDDRQAIAHGPIVFWETLTDCKGAPRTFETTKFPIHFKEKPVLLGGIAIDMTEYKKAESERERLQAQLIQSQKMESIGRLAGGVAHDFNNMLCVILGNVELCAMELDPECSLYKDLQEIRKAAERSANLTRQLLAFARRQTVTPKVLDLNITVGSMLKMLQRLIGENIDLSWQTDVDLWPVKLDPSQIDQILANLCVNARDAITTSGRLVIETRNASFDQDFCTGYTDATPGDYVVLSVIDNGCGMDESTREHLFEPFFTTKGLGKGTGLGLATVYGIVKQNNGFIMVSSERGNGTTVQIALPRYEEENEHRAAVPPPQHSGAPQELQPQTPAEALAAVSSGTAP